MRNNKVSCPLEGRDSVCANRVSLQTLGWGCVIVLIAATIFCTFSHLTVATSGSLDYRLFWETKAEIQRDDYVSFAFHGDKYYPKGTRFIKRAACLAGDLLQYKEGWHCNGIPLKNGTYSVYKTSMGDELPIFQFNGVMPDGKYFMLGDVPNSYDSKYWGFMDGKRLETVLKAIL